jgi:hypothetical protein
MTKGRILTLLGIVISLAAIAWAAELLLLAVVKLGTLLPSPAGFEGLLQACGILATSILYHACQLISITALGIFCTSRHGWSLRSMSCAREASVS